MGRADRAGGGRAPAACRPRPVGGVQRGRHARGHGVGRQHGAGVGCADRAGGGLSPSARRRRPVRGVQRGRHARGHGVGDNTARVWDARTGQAVGAPLRHADAVQSAAFSADGTRRSHRVGRQDGTGVGRADRASHWAHRCNMQNAVWSAAFSPDGTRVVTASRDNTAQVWDARTGQAVGAPLQHAGGVSSAAFSTDGTRVVDSVGGRDGAGVGCADRTGSRRTPCTMHAVVSSATFSARRNARGHGVVRQDGAGLGRAHRTGRGRAPAACRHRPVGGVQRGRHAGGHGVERQDGADVGRADRAGGGARRCSMQAASIRRRSARTGRGSSRRPADATARVWDARTGAGGGRRR